jgi:DNA polymerase III, delta subunit
MNIHQEIHIPAHLWIGSPDKLQEKAISYIQTIFCLYRGCGTCVTCLLISEKRYYAAQWVVPEKQWYTIGDLEQITKTVVFMLDEGRNYVIVLEDADKLSASCANSLLKMLEEPPQGYQFILLASRQDLVLPTVASRCLVYVVPSSSTHNEIASFCELFKVMPNSMVIFDKMYESSFVGEQDPLLILDEISSYWMSAYQKLMLDGEFLKAQHIYHIVAELSYAYEHLPMPGSSKMFWRNLLLKIMITLR